MLDNYSIKYFSGRIKYIWKAGIGISLLLLVISFYNIVGLYEYSFFVLILSLLFNFLSIETNNRKSEVEQKRKTTENTLVLFICIGLGVLLTYLLTGTDRVSSLNINLKMLLLALTTFINLDYNIRYYYNRKISKK